MESLKHDVTFLLESTLGIHQREQLGREHVLMEEPLLTVIAYLAVVVGMAIEAVVRHLHHIITDYATGLLQGRILLCLTAGSAGVLLALVGLLGISGGLVALAHGQHNVVVLFLGQ